MKPIPPLTHVRFIKPYPDVPESITELGKIYRIGYYSKQDGLDCVWLVNAAGEYQETTDQKSIENLFEVIQQSTETDLFGEVREQMKPIQNSNAIDG